MRAVRPDGWQRKRDVAGGRRAWYQSGEQSSQGTHPVRPEVAPSEPGFFVGGRRSLGTAFQLGDDIGELETKGFPSDPKARNHVLVSPDADGALRDGIAFCDHPCGNDARALL